MNSARKRPALGAGQGLIAIALSALFCTASAQDDFFDSIEVDTEAEREDGNYSLLGWLTQKVGYGYEDPGAAFARRDARINTLESSLFAQFDWQVNASTQFRLSGNVYHDELYRLDNRSDFSREEINELRNRYEIRDFYLEHETESGLYLKLGNQIINWGMSEYLRITDLVNTENQYTLGQQDLEDLRLQVPALLASVNLSGWTLESVVTWRAGRDDLSPAGDEFDPFLVLRQSAVVSRWQDPDRESELFLRAATRWAHGDLQFVAAEFNENRLSPREFVAEADADPRLRFTQNRSRALGFAGNWVSGSWLLFTELARHQNRSLRPLDSSAASTQPVWPTRDQWLSAVGVEFSGYRNLLLALEFDTIHTLDHSAGLGVPRQQHSFGARLYWTAFNERLELLGVWNELSDAAGQVGRVSLNYDWSDRVSTGLLWVHYDSEPGSVYYPYRNNDVIQAQLQYNFQF